MWTVHVTPHHLHSPAVEVAVVQAQVVLDVPVELARQLGPLHHLPVGLDPSPALEVQLVLLLATEILGDGGPHADLAEAHTEVVLLEAALGCVAPVLGGLGLQAGTSAQAEVSRVGGRVHTGQPTVEGGVQCPAKPT